MQPYGKVRYAPATSERFRSKLTDLRLNPGMLRMRKIQMQMHLEARRRLRAM